MIPQFQWMFCIFRFVHCCQLGILLWILNDSAWQFPKLYTAQEHKRNERETLSERKREKLWNINYQNHHGFRCVSCVAKLTHSNENSESNQIKQIWRPWFWFGLHFDFASSLCYTVVKKTSVRVNKCLSVKLLINSTFCCIISYGFVKIIFNWSSEIFRSVLYSIVSVESHSDNCLLIGLYSTVHSYFTILSLQYTTIQAYKLFEMGRKRKPLNPEQKKLRRKAKRKNKSKRAKLAYKKEMYRDRYTYSSDENYDASW